MALLERGGTIDLVANGVQPLTLRDPLLPPALSRYDALGSDIQEAHAQMLSGVKRMGTARKKGFLIDPSFIETNREHVGTSLEMALEYSDNYPILNDYIRFDGVQTMLLHHDDGEGVPSIGDVPVVDRTEADERRKKLEHRAAGMYVFSHIPDPDARKVVKSHYKVYAANDPKNLDVQMTRFIDKAQGTTRAAEIAFNVEEHINRGNTETAEKIREHLFNTIPRMMEPAVNLLTYLPEQRAREAMREIIFHEFSRLEQVGASDIVQPFNKRVS